jgi:hypothetical protein
MTGQHRIPGATLAALEMFPIQYNRYLITFPSRYSSVFSAKTRFSNILAFRDFAKTIRPILLEVQFVDSNNPPAYREGLGMQSRYLSELLALP